MNKYILNFFVVSSIFVAKNLNAGQNIENFIGKCLKDGGVIFDIGANVGEKTTTYLKLGAKVICVEPQPSCVEVLFKKYGGNANVVIVDKAVGDKSGKMYMNICSSASTISSLSSDWINKSRFCGKYKWDQKIEVDVITLDELIKQFGIPSFCKIDVENFEYEVIKGLSNKIKLLSFECNIEFFDNTIKCVNLLQKLGYKKFNIGFAREETFAFNKWQNVEQITKGLEAKKGTKAWGDVYAWF